jgi:hypothetical protein
MWARESYWQRRWRISRRLHTHLNSMSFCGRGGLFTGNQVCAVTATMDAGKFTFLPS